MSEELVEEIVNIHDLSRKQIFARKQYFMGFMGMDSKLCSMDSDLERFQNDDYDFLVKQVSLFNQAKNDLKVLEWDWELGQSLERDKFILTIAINLDFIPYK